MVLRMLRVALPTDEAEPSEADPRDGQARGAAAGDGRLPGVPARDPGAAEGEPGRLASCSTSAPTRTPSAHSVSALHDALTAADSSYRSSAPVLRLSRLMADLDFRSRSVEGAGPLAADARPGPARARARRRRHRPALLRRRVRARRQTRDRLMHFAIRYLTEYRYDGPVTDNLNALRVTPATTDDPARRRLRRARGAAVAAAPAPRLLRHVRDRVRHRQGRTTRSRSTCARAWRPPGRPTRRAGDWPALEGDAYRAPRDRVPAPLRGRAGRPAHRRARRPRRAPTTPAGDARARRAGDPGPLRVPRRRDLRRLEGRGSARRGRRRVPGLRAPRARAPAPQRDRARATSPATCSRRPRGSEDADSAEVETHAWLEALIPPDDGGGEPQWVGIDPTNRCLAGRALREDRPRPPLPRRAADQGRLPRHGQREAGCVGADAPHRRGRCARRV